MTAQLTPEEAALVKSTRRFDLRRILGALFVFYGLVVFIIGLFNNATDMKQTGGIAINLWAGGAMLALGILFFVWDRLSPVPEEDIVSSLHKEEADKEKADKEEADNEATDSAS